MTLTTDRPAMRDYEEGRIRFGRSPDQAVYFAVTLRDYLRHRDEASLFESDQLLDKIKRLPISLNPSMASPIPAPPQAVSAGSPSRQ